MLLECAELAQKRSSCAVLLRLLIVSPRSTSSMKWVQFSNLHIDVPKELTKPTVCAIWLLLWGAILAVNLSLFPLGCFLNTFWIKMLHSGTDEVRLKCPLGALLRVQVSRLNSKGISYPPQRNKRLSVPLLWIQHPVKTCHQWNRLFDTIIWRGDFSQLLSEPGPEQCLWPYVQWEC